MMGGSIVFIIYYSLLFGKAMKLLEFVLFNRGILFIMDRLCYLIAYYWYDAYEYPFNIIQYIAILLFFITCNFNFN